LVEQRTFYQRILSVAIWTLE